MTEADSPRVRVLRIRRFLTFALVATVLVPSTLAACVGGDNDSSGPDRSQEAGLDTTTLPRLTLDSTTTTSQREGGTDPASEPPQTTAPLALSGALASPIVGDDELDRARAECASRDGYTELLPAANLYICYEVTVEDDGWRLCNASEPWLSVRVETPPESAEYPCGNTGPRWPDYEPPVWEQMTPEAPSGCEAAQNWYAYYLELVSDELRSLIARAESLDAAAIQSSLSVIGHLFEQNGGGAEAAQDSCQSDETLSIDQVLDVHNAISEVRSDFDEVYKSIVVDCVTDGIYDCTALAPTAKATCEAMSPEFVYLLDAFALDVLTFEGWPGSAPSYCSLRG